MAALGYCVNAVIPVFLIVLIGWLASSVGKLKDDFFAVLNRLVYGWLVPISIFRSVYIADLAESFDRRLLLFAMAGIALSAALAFVVARIFVKKEQRATFTQAGYKSNYLFVAIPVIKGLFGAAGLPKANMIAPFVAVFNNIITVTVFDLYQNGGESGLRKAGKTLLMVLKNPLVIAPVLALPFAIWDIEIPQLIYAPIDAVASISSTVALFGLGGAIKVRNFRRTALPAVSSAALKTLLLPAIAVPVAVSLGFRGVELGILTVLFCAPIAVNAYSTAVQLGGDGELAANALILSMFLSVTSIVGCVSLLMSLGLV